MLQESLEKIIEKLNSLNAKNICTFDTQGKNNLAKYIVLSSFENHDDCKNACNEILNLLNDLNIQLCNLEGLNKGSWIVIDLKDLILHILITKEREKYNLERLYKDYKKF